MDDLVARYAVWRDDAAAVRESYRSWCNATRDQEKWLFTAYCFAVDHEEASAKSYELAVADVRSAMLLDGVN